MARFLSGSRQRLQLSRSELSPLEVYARLELNVRTPQPPSARCCIVLSGRAIGQEGAGCAVQSEHEIIRDEMAERANVLEGIDADSLAGDRRASGARRLAMSAGANPN
jgi:hypothetical protein